MRTKRVQEIADFIESDFSAIQIIDFCLAGIIEMK